MTAVKPAALEQFARRPQKDIRAIILYGADEARVSEMARKIVVRVAGSADDPFNVVKFDERALADDSGRLADEVNALSMFGGNRVVWVTGADAALAKVLAPLLAQEVAGNLIIAEAGGLQKSSALRQMGEESSAVLIAPFYEPTDDEVRDFLQSGLAAEGLAIGSAALERLTDLMRRDRGAASQEIAKLASYCMGGTEVSLADVEACCSSGGEERLDDLIDAVFGGEVEEADRMLMDLLAGGTDGGRIVSAAHGHCVRLQEFRLKMAGGQTAEGAVRGARPAVFFARVRAIVGQLQVWQLEGLAQAAQTLAVAVEKSRTQSSLAVATVGRALLSVSRTARASRRARV